MTTTNVTMQQRRDTSANWKTNNPVINSGEICFETDTGKMKIGNGKDNYLSLPYKANDDIYKMTDELYNGVDLSVKFADEIKNYPDVWAWIKARITANNYDGIHIGDYIPFALSAGTISDGATSYSIGAKTLNAQIVGIDTYYQYGYKRNQGHHIDFISTACIGTNIPWQKVDNNNGHSGQAYPWLASKIYACLNGVDNTGTGYGGVALGYNASSCGVLQLLPVALQNQIADKELFTESRYSGSGLLTNQSGGDTIYMGKLWLPTEVEVYGFPCNSQGADQYGINRSAYGSIQYPFFKCRNSKNKNRVHWWLSSVASGSSRHACAVNSNGLATTPGCASAGISAPVCFRIGV